MSRAFTWSRLRDHRLGICGNDEYLDYQLINAFGFPDATKIGCLINRFYNGEVVILFELS